MNLNHECEQMRATLKPKKTKPGGRFNDKFMDLLEKADIPFYGPSIAVIEYVEEGDFWVAHCGEYATKIKFCPFCGGELYSRANVCRDCRADYEGNEPLNCKIYNKTLSCKFVKEDWPGQLIGVSAMAGDNYDGEHTDS